MPTSRFWTVGRVMTASIILCYFLAIWLPWYIWHTGLIQYFLNYSSLYVLNILR